VRNEAKVSEPQSLNLRRTVSPQGGQGGRVPWCCDCARRPIACCDILVASALERRHLPERASVRIVPAPIAAARRLKSRTTKVRKTAGKTGKPRRIRVGEKLGPLLAHAIGERWASVSVTGGESLDVPNLSRTYSRLRDLAGLPKDLVLYLARHECGTKICREKGIEYARRLLGHTNISTTQRYMHLDDQELADAQDLID